jgi:hypothetical protein
MRTTLLSLHLLFAGIWIGCVLTEALFERVLLAGDRAAHLTLSSLHVRVDKYVEIPMIVGVLLTGAVLWSQGHRAGASFHLMAGAGLVAIAANLHCVGIVFKRHRAALAGNWPEFDRLDHLQHKVGGVVLAGLVVAVGAGVWGRVGA